MLSRICARWSLSFTFHYASTLSTRAVMPTRTTPAFTFHYASTLSHVEGLSDVLIAEFTFHYASTLSKHGEALKHFEIPFTFHYASTLYQTGPRGNRKRRNLHSTMLLLYLVEASPDDHFVLIYIPLCFYFILARQSLQRWQKHIYIPLCFYFIRTSCIVQG